MKTVLGNFVYPVLTWFARKLLEKHRPKIIGITGSVGKTSTKRAVGAAIEQSFKTQWFEGNYNSAFGLPIAIFNINYPTNISNPLSWLRVWFQMASKLLFWKYPYDVLVLELGIASKGWMDEMLTFVDPDVAFITAIQQAHLEGLGSKDEVYNEKIKLARAADTVFINGDDEFLKNKYLQENPDAITYGLGKENTIHPTAIERNNRTLAFNVTLDNQIIKTHFIARYSLLPVVAGWAAANTLGADVSTARQGLEELTPFPGRMNVLPGKQGSTLIDDSYNNVSPEAALAAIQALEAIPAKRRIMVLGSMNEMGDQAESGHRKVAKYLLQSNISQLYLVGTQASEYIGGYLEEKKSSFPVASFRSPFEAGQQIAPELKNGDVVLIKGSQNGVFTEEVTALLLKLESDRSHLVRQSSSWMKKKHRQFNT